LPFYARHHQGRSTTHHLASITRQGKAKLAFFEMVSLKTFSFVRVTL
jgi:hypothetical protein